MNQQTFVETETWFEFVPGTGTKLLPLAEPVPKGSIHRLKMIAGTVIPVHYHPCDEYVYVLNGTIETAGRKCKTEHFGLRLLIPRMALTKRLRLLSLLQFVLVR